MDNRPAPLKEETLLPALGRTHLLPPWVTYPPDSTTAYDLRTSPDHPTPWVPEADYQYAVWLMLHCGLSLVCTKHVHVEEKEAAWCVLFDGDGNLALEKIPPYMIRQALAQRGYFPNDEAQRRWGNLHLGLHTREQPLRLGTHAQRYDWHGPPAYGDAGAAWCPLDRRPLWRRLRMWLRRTP